MEKRRIFGIPPLFCKLFLKKVIFEWSSPFARGSKLGIVSFGRVIVGFSGIIVSFSAVIVTYPTAIVTFPLK
jgi:hypothetical protein